MHTLAEAENQRLPVSSLAAQRVHKAIKTAHTSKAMENLTEMTPNDKQLIVSELRKRFVITGRSSGQDNYYDLLRDSSDCTHQNIVQCAVERGLGYEETRQSLLSRDQFKSVTKIKYFRPHKSKLVKDQGIYSINSWHPSTIIPNASISAEPWIEHIELVLGDESKANYFIDMLAYRFQNPCTPKPHVAFYLYGKEGGSGKTTFLRTLELVFGQSAVKTTNTVRGLNSGSATELWSRTWLCIDEANITKGSAIYDQIKSYTGNDYVESDKKHQDFARYEIPAQLIMISNRQPAFIEEADRRFFISEWLMPNDIDKPAYFNELNDWLSNMEGYEAIAGHLQSRKITAKPHEAPPMTPEKQSAMQLTKDPAITAIEDFLAGTDAKLFTTDELKRQQDETYIKGSRLKHIFAEVGLIETNRIRIKGIQGQNRYWHKKEYRLERTGEGNKLAIGDSLVQLEDCIHKPETTL